MSARAGVAATIVAVWGTMCAMSTSAVAQVDPTAPLDFLKKGRDAAASSNLTVNGLTTMANNGVTIVSLAGGAAGLALCLASLLRIYRANQDGHREDQGRAWVSAGVSGLIGIVGVVYGAMTSGIVG